MFFFKSQPKIKQKEAAIIGFVLALMSVLASALIGYVSLALNAFLIIHGATEMSILLILTAITVFLAVQGLLLFGFPLYYVQDQKNHMTGFQILVFEVLWILVVAGILMALGIFL